MPEFDKAAFALKSNELSQPVKTAVRLAHHPGALAVRKPRRRTPLSQVKAAIEQQLLQQKKKRHDDEVGRRHEEEFATKIAYQVGYAPPPASTASTGGDATTSSSSCRSRTRSSSCRS